MDRFYPICWNGQTVGEATVAAEGLYCRISCKCNLPDDRPWRIRMENTDLGICWAMGKARGLRTKLPKKQMPGEDLHFFAYLPEEGRFYPLNPEEGFPKMDSLMSAVFCSREGKPGLIIK